MEEAALKKEKDPVSKARLEEVHAELAGLQEQLQPLLARYKAEKHRLEEIRTLRKKREDLLVSANPCCDSTRQRTNHRAIADVSQNHVQHL